MSAGVEKLTGSRRRALIMINRKARSAATSLDEACCATIKTMLVATIKPQRRV
jgi:hypothetical protein